MFVCFLQRDLLRCDRNGRITEEENTKETKKWSYSTRASANHPVWLKG